MKTCNDCRFWKAPQSTEQGLKGECRRFPPDSGGFGITEPDDWCGEFSSRTDEGRSADLHYVVPEHLRDKPIDDIGLQKQFVNALRSRGIYTLGHFAGQSPSVLNQVVRIGEVGAAEIQKRLTEYGVDTSRDE